MSRISANRIAILTAIVLGACSASPAAQAQDFFSALFGGMSGQNAAPPSMRMPFGADGAPVQRREARPHYSGGSAQAFCVRTCDGRYFPLSTGDGQSRAASCNSFCPASETKVVYGSTIDQAATDSGKPYSELPNAFRYRNELVSGCTCNGKDAAGLASIKIENDPTLRKGDIVASGDGLMVSRGGADKRGAALSMSPASPELRARYERVPVVAAD